MTGSAVNAMSRLPIPTEGSTPDRQTLDAIKTRLKDILGKEMWTQYWDTFKKFVSCKLSKAEMDHTLRGLLKTDETITMHNQLVMAILFNAIHHASTPGLQAPARLPPPPPLPQFDSPATKALPPKPKRLKTDHPKQPMKPAKRNLDCSLIAADKERTGAHGSSIMRFEDSVSKSYYPAETFDLPIGALPRMVKDVDELAGDASYYTSDPHYQVYDLEDVDFCDRSWDLPDVEALKNRMLQTCLECGLSAVSDDAVSVLEKGLEMRMRDVIRKCIAAARPHRVSAAAAASIGLSLPVSKDIETLDNLVTTFDIAAVAEIYPQLFGDDRPRARERVSAIQF